MEVLGLDTYCTRNPIYQEEDDQDELAIKIQDPSHGPDVEEHSGVGGNHRRKTEGRGILGCPCLSPTRCMITWLQQQQQQQQRRPLQIGDQAMAGVSTAGSDNRWVSDYRGSSNTAGMDMEAFEMHSGVGGNHRRKTEGRVGDQAMAGASTAGSDNLWVPDSRGSSNTAGTDMGAFEMMYLPASDVHAYGYPGKRELRQRELPILERASTGADIPSIEQGGGRERSDDGNPDTDSDPKWKCKECGPSHLYTRLLRMRKTLSRAPKFVRSQSRTRLILCTVISIFFVGLALFLGLFPASFVYVEYYQVALKQSKMTHVVDRETVYYTGCYLLGLDTRFITFQTTALEITENLDVFTLDTLSINIEYSAHYFVRPEEIADLYSMFLQDYIPFFQKVVKTMIRNTAATTLTVDHFRFNRTHVERQLHAKLRQKLGGNCCPRCCQTTECEADPYCSECNQNGCDPGYHVDVRYFYLMTVTISDAVVERYMQRNVLEIEEEREPFLQSHTLIVKETQFLAEKHKNAANEVIGNATAHADSVTIVSTADSEKIVQSSYIHALKELYSVLNITSEEYKLSFMMIRALEDVSWNLYAGYGYNDNKLFAP